MCITGVLVRARTLRAKESAKDLSCEKERADSWLFGSNRLELGAGGGLVGLAVALGCELQQTPLYLTDQDEMFELMGRNTELNNLQNKVKPFVLNWCVISS